MNSRKRIALLIMLSVLSALTLAGCSDDPVEPAPDPSPYVWPDTAEKLMENFEAAYGGMDIDAYDDILRPDFRYVFVDGEMWDRVDEMNSAAHMFAGNPPDYMYGIIADGIQSVTIDEMTQIGEWTEVAADQTYFPGSWLALYDIRIRFYLDGGENTITVMSDQIFYATSEEIAQDDGGTRTRFSLVGQRDIEDFSRDTESIGWGDIKALWLPCEPNNDAYPWPDTADTLIANLEQAYGTMDYLGYRDVLHPDFKFVFTDGTTWTRSEDTTSTLRLFSGIASGDEYGAFGEPVDSITIYSMNRVSDWTHVPANHPLFPDSGKALYDVYLVLHLEGGGYTLTVSNQNLFYIKQESERQCDGTLRDRIYLVGHEDPAGAKNEDLTWGDIKVRWGD